MLSASARGARAEPVVIEPRDLVRIGATDPVAAGAARSRGEVSDAGGRAPTLAEALDDTRRARIASAVADADGNWAAAARALGVDRANLHRLARRLGLK